MLFSVNACMHIYVNMHASKHVNTYANLHVKMKDTQHLTPGQGWPNAAHNYFESIAPGFTVTVSNDNSEQS
jgi:hypothetical protein